jgi:hypothetical protein
VKLGLDAAQKAFLRRELLTAREGLRADMAEFPEDFPDPAGVRREIAAFDRLLDGIAGGYVVADRATRDLARTISTSIDAGNEFGRVLFEHSAARAPSSAITPVVRSRG